MTLDQERKLIQETISFAVEDRKKSWLLFLTTILLTLCCFIAALTVRNVAIQAICGVAAGLCLGRLFVIYHDYNHKAILVRSKIADIIMKLFGLFALAPRSIWNHVHDHHHEHNSQFIDIVLGSFPILEKKQFYALSKSAQRKYLVIRHPVTIALSYLSVFMISFCLYPFFENPRKYWDGLLSFVLHIFLSVLIFNLLGPTSWLLGILLPFFLMGLLGGYVFYAQHNFPGVKLMDEDRWSYTKAALLSSSYIKMNGFWKWVTANVGYHHVHHINPRIPFYRLPEAMNYVDALRHPATTSFAVSDIKACLKLKLWDADKQEMVGIR